MSSKKDGIETCELNKYDIFLINESNTFVHNLHLSMSKA